jgi:hypothetical protein
LERRHTMLTVVPEILRGNHTYVVVIKLSECHLSPMYIGTPFIEATAAV